MVAHACVPIEHRRGLAGVTRAFSSTLAVCKDFVFSMQDRDAPNAPEMWFTARARVSRIGVGSGLRPSRRSDAGAIRNKNVLAVCAAARAINHSMRANSTRSTFAVRNTPSGGAAVPPSVVK